MARQRLSSWWTAGSGWTEGFVMVMVMVMVMVRVDRRFCDGDGRGGNRAFFFFLILLWWWTQTLSPGKTLYECHIDDAYVTQLWRNFQMWAWVPSRRRPPLWVRWFQLLPMLLKVKTFSLFYFSSHALYSRWGCLSFFLFTGGVIVVQGPSTALATLVLTTGGTR